MRPGLTSSVLKQRPELPGEQLRSQLYAVRSNVQFDERAGRLDGSRVSRRLYVSHYGHWLEHLFDCFPA